MPFLLWTFYFQRIVFLLETGSENKLIVLLSVVLFIFSGRGVKQIPGAHQDDQC